MLDHVFTDAIGALREALHGALLERQAFEERFQADVLLGDLTWETSYALPGEGEPPRVQVDVTMDWPTWAQTSYRSWYIGEPTDEPPRTDIKLALRVQRLASRPDPSIVLATLPIESPSIGGDTLERSGPTIEQVFTVDLDQDEFALEVSYEGSYELGDDVLEDGNRLDRDFGTLGGWISSTLVLLGDLTFDFKPPFEPEGPSL